MTDKQLAVLLENYSRRVCEIIEIIEDENPELQEEYKAFFGKSRRIKALDPLRAFQEDLDNDISELTEGHQRTVVMSPDFPKSKL